MDTAGLQIIAPALTEQTWNEAEVLGSAVWLWMHSPSHRYTPLYALPSLLLPAIKHRQFLLAVEVGRPVFYLAWANLSVEAEARYLKLHALHMDEAEWNSGDRLWIFDWVAPFGHTRRMERLLRRQLFSSRCGRALYHRGDERGPRIKTFHGRSVLSKEARRWFAQHPVAFTEEEGRTHKVATQQTGVITTA